MCDTCPACLLMELRLRQWPLGTTRLGVGQSGGTRGGWGSWVDHVSGLWTPSHLSPPATSQRAPCGHVHHRWESEHPQVLMVGVPSVPSRRWGWLRPGGGGGAPMPGVQDAGGPPGGGRPLSLGAVHEFPPRLPALLVSSLPGSRQPGVHIHEAMVLGKLGVWYEGHPASQRA